MARPFKYPWQKMGVGETFIGSNRTLVGSANIKYFPKRFSGKAKKDGRATILRYK